WVLHNALQPEQGRHPLDTESPFGLAAALIGMPGIGKTTLLAAYCRQFGAAYPGGVYWNSLAGADSASPERVLGRYADEVRAIADTLGIAAGGTRQQVAGRIADHLYRKDGPSLWIIDDVPDSLDPALLRQMIIPAGVRMRTVFVARTSLYG